MNDMLLYLKTNWYNIYFFHKEIIKVNLATSSNRLKNDAFI
jgi:hypothetical protein